MVSIDRTALITGGSGGLGRAVVAGFAADGWRVVVPDVAPAELEGAEVVAADLSDPAEAARVAELAAGREVAPLRAVVNLVGGFAADQPVAETPVEEFEAQFALNLRPTYLVTQAALPALVAAGGGAIVCMSSRSALYPFAGAAGYCVVQGRADRVRAGRRARARPRRRALQRGAAVDDRHPANRAAMPPEDHAKLTPPEQIAAVIRFLCSDESAATTGAAIPVYGGP